MSERGGRKWFVGECPQRKSEEQMMLTDAIVILGAVGIIPHGGAAYAGSSYLGSPSAAYVGDVACRPWQRYATTRNATMANPTSFGMVRLTACVKIVMTLTNSALSSVVHYVAYLMLMVGLLR